MNNYISESAKIHLSVNMGRNIIIEDNVEIGENVQLGHGVVIREGTRIGNNVRIDDYAVLGKLPMKARFSVLKTTGELEPCVIGSNVMIGTSAVIYRGARLGDSVLVADLATIRERVTIGDFTIVGRGVAVENDTVIGSCVKLETNSYITAFSVVEDSVFVAPCVTTTNDNYLGRTEKRHSQMKGCTFRKGSRIGGNAIILPGRTVGCDALVGAGSIVTHDVQEKKIVVGSPARPTRDVPEDELLENQKDGRKK